jgi:ABC-type uncharacterized transport system auxiliary subunit
MSLLRAPWPWLLLLCGCRFGGPALEPRYFSPAPFVEAAPMLPAAPVAAGPLELREVRAAAHLRERLVWHDGRAEFGFYEEWRWVEPPAELVRRTLDRALAQCAGPAVGPRAVLWVELLAFEERRGAGGGATVRLRAERTEEGAASTRQFAATVPCASGRPEALAEALGSALAQVAGEVAAFAAQGQ